MHKIRPPQRILMALVGTTLTTALLLSGCGAGADKNMTQGPPAGQTIPEKRPAQDNLKPGDNNGTGDVTGPEATPPNPADNEIGQPTAPNPTPNGPLTAEQFFQFVPDRSSLPEAIQTWYDNGRQQEGAFVVDATTQRYLLISAGTRPTGGYSLTVDKTVESKNGWRLEVVLDKPSPGAIVTQVVTYPSLLFELPAGADDIEVILHDGNQSRALPITSGPDETH